MGFYSSLNLVADNFSEIPIIADVNQLLDQLELTRENGRLANDTMELFNDPAAWEENESFFHPDSISVRHEIEIMDPEYDSWDSQGISISIHGGGLFYPWGTEQLVAVIKHPKLIALHDAVEKQFGGSFTTPITTSPTLEETLIYGERERKWFGSQS